METTKILNFDQSSFDAFVAGRSEPDWLQRLRREAWDAFQQMPWPNRSDEQWRRTDIRPFRLSRYGWSPEGDDISFESQALLDRGVELAGRSVAVNSRRTRVELDERLTAQGVVFGSLDELVCGAENERIARYLYQQIDPRHGDRFAALHGAFWSGGHYLFVPRHVAVDRPFHLLNVVGASGVDLSHTLIILEEGAEATVLAETESRSPEDDGFHCGAVELCLAPGAHLRYVNLQNWGHGVWHFARQKATVLRDASLQWTSGAIGGRLAMVNQDVVLAGEAANCQVNGVMFTENNQHFAYHTLQLHEAPHTQSDFLYKAALQDRSRTVWRGMIRVEPTARGTNGYQRNDNLLLSADARADSIPGLEIETDDVRCTHGSTSGRVDEEMIFYARCRGFTRKEATQMIVTGFFQQVFDRITIDSVREALGQAIARRVREYE